MVQMPVAEAPFDPLPRGLQHLLGCLLEGMGHLGRRPAATLDAAMGQNIGDFALREQTLEFQVVPVETVGDHCPEGNTSCTGRLNEL